MYTGVVQVQATDDHKLILTFDNNEHRLFDIAPYLNIGRFAELKDINVFKKIGLAFDTVEWENGLDMDPEFLYENSERIVSPTQTG